MSAVQIRIRRLSRLAARAQAELRSAEQGLAVASREAAAAGERARSIATILAESRATVGDRGPATLLAGAHLRQLLEPAAAAAAAARLRMGAEQAQAEQQLRAASARSERLAERLAEARRTAGAEIERRSTDLTPPTRKRT